MSKIALSGNSLGSGTLTISAPNTNVDRVLELPDEAGTVLTTATPGVPVNGPAFSAYPSSSQSISNNTYTKILFQTEEFDTNNNFASSTFTPTVAGYYQVNLSITPTTTVTLVEAAIYKNGTAIKRSYFVGTNGMAITSALIYMNGTTDYLDGYGFVSGTTPSLSANLALTYFQASMVRAA
jgi:hypothetical protein